MKEAAHFAHVALKGEKIKLLIEQPLMVAETVFLQPAVRLRSGSQLPVDVFAHLLVLMQAFGVEGIGENQALKGAASA